MTDKQKTTIMRMRAEGMAVSKISEIVNLSPNTIKTFFRRNKDDTCLKPNNKDCCLQCGKKITQKKHRKIIKFCCSECRVKWWNSHPEAVKKKAIYTFICPFCLPTLHKPKVCLLSFASKRYDKTFTAYGNKKRKYCSHECYINDRFKGGVIDG